MASIGCQHIAENFQIRENDQMVMHAWVLSTKFKNKLKDNTLPGKTKVYLLGKDKLRMDVYDPFGLVSMGQLILNGSHMSLDTINGISYKGVASKERIKQLLKIEVSSQDLFALFTQQGLDGKAWSCSVAGEYNKYSSCKSPVHQTEITWSGSMTQKNTQMVLDHAKAELIFKVKSYNRVSEPNERVFKL